MNKKYILKDKVPVEVFDLSEWGMWFETNSRIVASDMIRGVHISTVFLGLDHNYTLEGPPILFETMIFGGMYNQYQQRYRTYEGAEGGHKKAVQMVKEFNYEAKEN